MKVKLRMSKIDRLFASLAALGINPKMETFTERKRVQIAVYLLDKVFGMNFGYSYSWYLYGPYSPPLTQIIFNVIDGDQKVNIQPNTLSVSDLQKIEKMKKFLGDDLNSSDTLELLVSVQFLLGAGKNSTADEKEAVEFLNQKKPYFTNEEVQGAIRRLQKLKN